MTDDTSFPTAPLVPVRPGGRATERYDALARRIADPMTTLFLLLHSQDPDLRFKAAAELMPYRYPRLKVSDVNHNGAGAPTVNIQINIGK